MRSEITSTLDELESQRLTDPDDGDLDRRMLAVGPETARFCNTLLRAQRATRALEIGGSMGYSTIWLAEALESNGGSLVSMEAVPEKVDAIRRRTTQAGLDNVVDVRAGDALSLLSEIDGPFDFVLVDAWKYDYLSYFELAFPKLRVGGVLVADNITFPDPGPGIDAYVERARSHADAQSQLVAVGNGLELTVRLR